MSDRKDCLTCKHEPTWIPWDDGMPQRDGECLIREDKPKLLALPQRISRKYIVLCNGEGLKDCPAYEPKERGQA